MLVNLDGDPIWSPIKDNDLKFAVNTNWDLFEHAPTNTFYLRAQPQLADRRPTVEGPWKPAGTLPGSFAKLPADDNWKDVKAALPGRTLTDSQVPKVFVSTKPAELILLSGARQLSRSSPSTAAVGEQHRERRLPLGKGGPVYFLVSGRWFSAPDFTGPWTFATPTLPEDFKKIPLEHARSRVLASVPGTDAGGRSGAARADPADRARRQEAGQGARGQLSGRAELSSRSKRPRWQRAVNTDKDIIKVGDLYLHVLPGRLVHVEVAGRPVGSHRHRCPAEIYEIPPSSPSYNVTQVTVVEDNSDAVVYATAAAYTGVMIGWGCAVWGTGYYYPPYVGYGGFYPAYYPYYPSYGYHALVQPVDRRLQPRRQRPTDRTAAPASARATTRAPAPTRAARPPTGRTAPAASPAPTTRAPARPARRGKARTSTAAGDRPACSAAISGRRPRASPTTDRRDDAHDRRAAAAAPPSPAIRPAPATPAASRRPAAATSTPAATATSTRSPATAGSSTATAAGTTCSSRRRSSANRRSSAPRRRRTRARAAPAPAPPAATPRSAS